MRNRISQEHQKKGEFINFSLLLFLVFSLLRTQNFVAGEAKSFQVFFSVTICLSVQANGIENGIFPFPVSTWQAKGKK